MAISISTDRTDETGREILDYGTADFPIAFFDDDLTKVRVPWHWHDEAEIIIILQGSVTVSFHGKEYILRENEGYFANSAVLHSTRLNSETGWQHSLVFDPELISSKDSLVYQEHLSRIIGNENLPFVCLRNKIDWQREIIELAERAWQAGAYETPDYSLEVTYALGKVFSLLTNHLDEALEDVSEIRKLTTDEIKIKRMLNYIFKHYSENVRIEDVADYCGISVSSLLRLSKKNLHTSPMQYLLSYRLEESAKKLLKNPEMTISEIAYSCGFNDASYFNRCFLKKSRMTPSRYRLENQNRDFD